MIPTRTPQKKHLNRAVPLYSRALGLLSFFVLLLSSCEEMVVTPPAFEFLPPAFQQDFSDDPAKQAQLVRLWNTNLNAFIAQGTLGDPWNASNMDGATQYFNPSATSPQGAAIAEIIWGAWPGRVAFYFENLPMEDQLSISDRGLMANGSQPPLIPAHPCSINDGVTQTFGPYGPRGFQDEYSEWSVQRDADGVITRIDFTCENPEYWNSLWMVDPNRVLEIYQQTLDYASITLDDLILHDAQGNKVIDPSTGRPVYNPLNKWNSGSGGAMHLTSTPNTLQTEIGLASSSTLQRSTGNANQNALICCGEFGQNYRNSDPHIGGSVNRIVEAGFQVTLTNPPGLYIQMPNFSQYEYQGKPIDAESFWTIRRGTKTLVNEYGDTLPGNFILHATFEVPADRNFRVGDMTIAGDTIRWGGQIAQTYNMQIVASALPSKGENPVKNCAGNPQNRTPAPQQLFHGSVFTAMLQHQVANPMQQPMNLLSNSTYIPPAVTPGSKSVSMVITTDSINLAAGDPVLQFSNPDITSTYVSYEKVNYAVPGNSYPSESVALYFVVNIGENVTPGLYDVQLSAANQTPGPAMPSLLHIVQSIQ